jgi:hypothetical protein
MLSSFQGKHFKILYVMTSDGVSAMKFLTAAKITHSNKMEDLSREFWKRIYKTV